MIFLSLGTHEQPFPRAIDLIRPIAAAGERVVVQHGFTKPDPMLSRVEWHRLLDYDEIVGLIAEARGYVCHAGVGSIMTALHLNVTPVVIDRRRALHEHVDDHQWQIASRMDADGMIVHLADGDLEDALGRAASLKGYRGQSRSLHDEIRSIVGASPR